jgi:hypothetical protein
MKIFVEHQSLRADVALGWFSRITGLTRVLGGILFYVLLHNAVPALSAIVPPAQSVTLAWDQTTDPNVVGYRAHYGVASHAYTNMVDVGNATNVTISGLVQGTTYYFGATAYNTFGMESDFSNEVTYTVPGAAATLQVRVAANLLAVLTVTGQVGHSYELLATQAFNAWTVIGTVTLGASGSSECVDLNAANFAARFYRAQEKP